MCKTEVLSNTLEPMWNETHEIGPWFPGEALDFVVGDRRMRGDAKSLLARATLLSERFYPNALLDADLVLSENPKAKLTVSVTVVGQAAGAAAASAVSTAAASSATGLAASSSALAPSVSRQKQKRPSFFSDDESDEDVLPASVLKTEGVCDEVANAESWSGYRSPSFGHEDSRIAGASTDSDSPDSRGGRLAAIQSLPTRLQASSSVHGKRRALGSRSVSPDQPPDSPPSIANASPTPGAASSTASSPLSAGSPRNSSTGSRPKGSRFSEWRDSSEVAAAFSIGNIAYSRLNKLQRKGIRRCVAAELARCTGINEDQVKVVLSGGSVKVDAHIYLPPMSPKRPSEVRAAISGEAGRQAIGSILRDVTALPEITGAKEDAGQALSVTQPVVKVLSSSGAGDRTSSQETPGRAMQAASSPGAVGGGTASGVSSPAIANMAAGDADGDGLLDLFQVTVVKAIGLKHLNVSGDNMWCECVSDKRRRFKTKTVSNTLDPIWNETHEIACADGRNLVFTIYDAGDRGTKTEGSVMVSTSRIGAEGMEASLPISGLERTMLTLRIHRIGGAAVKWMAVKKGDTLPDNAVRVSKAVSVYGDFVARRNGEAGVVVCKGPVVQSFTSPSGEWEHGEVGEVLLLPTGLAARWSAIKHEEALPKDAVLLGRAAQDGGQQRTYAARSSAGEAGYVTEHDGKMCQFHGFLLANTDPVREAQILRVVEAERGGDGTPLCRRQLERSRSPSPTAPLSFHTEEAPPASPPPSTGVASQATTAASMREASPPRPPAPPSPGQLEETRRAEEMHRLLEELEEQQLKVAAGLKVLEQGQRQQKEIQSREQLQKTVEELQLRLRKEQHRRQEECLPASLGELEKRRLTASTVFVVTSAPVNSSSSGTASADSAAQLDTKQVLTQWADDHSNLWLAVDWDGRSRCKETDADKWAVMDTYAQEFTKDGYDERGVAFESLRKLTLTTLWFQLFAAQVKSTLRMAVEVCGDLDVTVCAVCLEGGPLSRVEANLMPAVVADAEEECQKASGSNVRFKLARLQRLEELQDLLRGLELPEDVLCHKSAVDKAVYKLLDQPYQLDNTNFDAAMKAMPGLAPWLEEFRIPWEARSRVASWALTTGNCNPFTVPRDGQGIAAFLKSLGLAPAASDKLRSQLIIAARRGGEASDEKQRRADGMQKMRQRRAEVDKRIAHLEEFRREELSAHEAQWQAERQAMLQEMERLRAEKTAASKEAQEAKEKLEAALKEAHEAAERLREVEAALEATQKLGCDRSHDSILTDPPGKQPEAVEKTAAALLQVGPPPESPLQSWAQQEVTNGGAGAVDSTADTSRCSSPAASKKAALSANRHEVVVRFCVEGGAFDRLSLQQKEDVESCVTRRVAQVVGVDFGAVGVSLCDGGVKAAIALPLGTTAAIAEELRRRLSCGSAGTALAKAIQDDVCNIPGVSAGGGGSASTSPTSPWPPGTEPQVSPTDASLRELVLQIEGEGVHTEADGMLSRRLCDRVSNGGGSETSPLPLVQEAVSSPSPSGSIWGPQVQAVQAPLVARLSSSPAAISASSKLSQAAAVASATSAAAVTVPAVPVPATWTRAGMTEAAKVLPPPMRSRPMAEAMYMQVAMGPPVPSSSSTAVPLVIQAHPGDVVIHSKAESSQSPRPGGLAGAAVVITEHPRGRSSTPTPASTTRLVPTPSAGGSARVLSPSTSSQALTSPRVPSPRSATLVLQHPAVASAPPSTLASTRSPRLAGARSPSPGQPGQGRMAILAGLQTAEATTTASSPNLQTPGMLDSLHLEACASCGNLFVDDGNFCRKCGRPRSVGSNQASTSAGGGQDLQSSRELRMGSVSFGAPSLRENGNGLMNGGCHGTMSQVSRGRWPLSFPSPVAASESAAQASSRLPPSEGPVGEPVVQDDGRGCPLGAFSSRELSKSDSSAAGALTMPGLPEAAAAAAAHPPLYVLCSRTDLHAGLGISPARPLTPRTPRRDSHASGLTPAVPPAAAAGPGPLAGEQRRDRSLTPPRTAPSLPLTPSQSLRPTAVSQPFAVSSSGPGSSAYARPPSQQFPVPQPRPGVVAAGLTPPAGLVPWFQPADRM
eukprot:TRINITY_DN29945_c0_g1_i4.p1 TRINITY_DN29945_c0_g1~~TRINITY_DN29945_c0_g1_i4.p1  ORF type:complete len:2081 (-),score=509.43 TRINITY_DN29945_c0_g1_i4:327-6569(-)